jgi:hypothetical protein
MRAPLILSTDHASDWYGGRTVLVCSACACACAMCARYYLSDHVPSIQAAVILARACVRVRARACVRARIAVRASPPIMPVHPIWGRAARGVRACVCACDQLRISTHTDHIPC